MSGITHEWKGTVLHISSDAGTSSMDLKGDTGPRGPQGPAGVILDDEGNVIWPDFATEERVLDLIEQAQLGGEVNLSNYATKAYVEELLGVIENGSY